MFIKPSDLFHAFGNAGGKDQENEDCASRCHLILGNPVHAQTQLADIPAATMRSATRMVLIDVIATDKNGNFVVGLEPTEFSVAKMIRGKKLSAFGSRQVTHPLTSSVTATRLYEPNALLSTRWTVLLDGLNHTGAGPALCSTTIIEVPADATPARPAHGGVWVSQSAAFFCRISARIPNSCAELADYGTRSCPGCPRRSEGKPSYCRLCEQWC
jgi:hypothetical protein